MPGINRDYLDVISRRIFTRELPFIFAWDLEAALEGDEEAYSRLQEQVSSYEKARGAISPPALRAPKIFGPFVIKREDLAEHVATISGIDAPILSPDRTSLWIADYVLNRLPPHSSEEIKQSAVVVADVYRSALDALAYRGFVRETKAAHAVIREQFEKMDQPPADLLSGVIALTRQLRERYELQDSILNLARFPGGQHDLQMRAAAYVIFRQHAKSWAEAAVRLDEINDLYDNLFDKLEFFGIRDVVIVREMVASVLTRALNAQEPDTLSSERLDGTFVEMTGREIEKLEEKGASWRRVGKMKIGTRLINAEEYYQMLLRTQRAFQASFLAGKGSFSGSDGGEGGAVSGGSGPAPATGSGNGPVASAKASFGSVAVEIDEVAVLEDEAFLANDVPTEEGAWLFIASNAEAPHEAALPMNLPVRR